MSDTLSSTPDYKVGDQANGHTLTENGWVLTQEKPKRSLRKPLFIGAGALVGLGVIGGVTFGGYTPYQDQQEKQAHEAALAEQQAEYDTFIEETDEVRDLLAEIDLATDTGLNYREHDDLTDDLVSEFARLDDIDGPTAEPLVEDLEELVTLYGQANNAWNDKIYGPSYEEDTNEALFQAAWAKADSLWDDVRDDVDEWETAIENGELPTPDNDKRA
jgi:hypothetical protein